MLIFCNRFCCLAVENIINKIVYCFYEITSFRLVLRALWRHHQNYIEKADPEITSEPACDVHFGWFFPASTSTWWTLEKSEKSFSSDFMFEELISLSNKNFILDYKGKAFPKNPHVTRTESIGFSCYLYLILINFNPICWFD